MSAPLKNNNSQNPSNEEKKQVNGIGKEIQLHISQERNGNVHLNKEQHNKLYKMLKKMVIEATPKYHGLKLMLSFPNTILYEQDNAAAKKGGRKITNNLVGETIVSFNPPQDPIFNEINFDELELPQEEGQMIKHERQFKFLERLQSWIILRRERPNIQSSDVYYRHTLSGRTFRSTVEVIKFFLYGIYPLTSRNEKRKINDNQQNATGSRASGKRNYSGSWIDRLK